MSVFITPTVLIVVLVSMTNPSSGQTNNYGLGLKAYQDKQYKYALDYLGKAVTDDKFEISGKELAIAHTYLAQMRTRILEVNMANYQVNQITNNAGNIQSTITQVSEALKFQSSNPKAEGLEATTKKLRKIIIKAATVLADTLVQMNNKAPSKAIADLSRFIIDEFVSIESISPDDWRLLNGIGIAYYNLDKKEEAMIRFEKARALFTQLGEKALSRLHIANYELTSQYLFDSQKDLTALDDILTEAIDYTDLVMTGEVEIEINEVTRLAKKQNRFQRMKTQASGQ